MRSRVASADGRVTRVTFGADGIPAD